MAENVEREGGDITAADMLPPSSEPSQIIVTFKDATVFITGATGFLGKLLLEKLLRTCDELCVIHILLREKNGKLCQERMDHLLEDVVFDRLKREKPHALEKVIPIQGDCSLPNLGLNQNDTQLLISTTNYIFHFASTTPFDNSLEKAIKTNIRASEDMVTIAKKCKNLRAMIYMSTAYAFCPRMKTVYEEFYQAPITHTDVKSIANALDERTLAAIAPILLGEWPNVFMFTKAVAEGIFQNQSSGLPLAIIRPSLVGGTYKEPVAGWLANLHGPSGIFVLTSLGVLRTLHCNPDFIVDLIPADYVINASVAAASMIAKTKSMNVNKEVLSAEDNEEAERITRTAPIYNLVSGPQKPLTWRTFLELCEKNLQEIPSTKQMWHHVFVSTANWYVYKLCDLLLHALPAYCMNLMGQSSEVLESYGQVKQFCTSISYFTTHQWHFRNSNAQTLWKCLNEEDKKQFEFSTEKLDWNTYMYTSVRGGRVYILKDPLETVPEGQKNRAKLKVYHYALMVFLSIVVFLPLICMVLFCY